jgi:hypothetical protein
MQLSDYCRKKKKKKSFFGANEEIHCQEKGTITDPTIIVKFSPIFVGFAYQGKDIVFRFILEYSSLRDIGPYSTLI